MHNFDSADDRLLSMILFSSPTPSHEKGSKTTSQMNIGASPRNQDNKLDCTNTSDRPNYYSHVCGSLYGDAPQGYHLVFISLHWRSEVFRRHTIDKYECRDVQVCWRHYPQRGASAPAEGWLDALDAIQGHSFSSLVQPICNLPMHLNRDTSSCTQAC